MRAAVESPESAGSDRTAVAGGAEPLRGQIEAQESRNWLLLAAHQILMRIGWVFKMESVIIPAFVDAVSGAGWVRGCVPLLNRFGQSVPPALAADWVRGRPLQKRVLSGAMFAMVLPVWGLGLVWWWAGGQARVGMTPVVLGLYALFSACVGVHQLAWGTTQGKLIRATRRGRLFTASTVLGVLPAMVLVWWWMRAWRARVDGGFALMFFSAGAFFFISSLVALLLVEPRDPPRGQHPGVAAYLRRAGGILRGDRDFARLCMVAALFGTVPILFPHYQALGRERLGLGGTRLVEWILAQYAALGAVSLVTGPLADRFGNRLALRLLVFTTAVTPFLAVGLAHVDPAWGRPWYLLVFAPLGLTPVTMKTLQNYTLELCTAGDHALYLSTMNLCLAVPFLGSPAVGYAVDLTSYEAVLLAGGGLILLAGVLTWRLAEPRHQRR